MENKNIPATYRPFLVFLTVYKTNRFRTAERCTLIRNICQAIGVSILLIVYVGLNLSYEITVCIREKLNLNVMSQALSFFLGYFQMLMVYFSLILKSDRIIDVIERINEIAEKRKIIFFGIFGK